MVMGWIGVGGWDGCRGRVVVAGMLCYRSSVSNSHQRLAIWLYSRGKGGHRTQKSKLLPVELLLLHHVRADILQAFTGEK